MVVAPASVGATLRLIRSPRRRRSAPRRAGRRSPRRPRRTAVGSRLRRMVQHELVEAELRVGGAELLVLVRRVDPAPSASTAGPCRWSRRRRAAAQASSSSARWRRTASRIDLGCAGTPARRPDRDPVAPVGRRQPRAPSARRRRWSAGADGQPCPACSAPPRPRSAPSAPRCGPTARRRGSAAAPRGTPRSGPGAPPAARAPDRARSRRSPRSPAPARAPGGRRSGRRA